MYEDPHLVSGGERVSNVDCDIERSGERDSALTEPVGQSLTRQVLHYEVGRTVVRSDVVERADPGVVQASNRARFLLEPRAKVRIMRNRVGQDLDCHTPIEPLS